MQLSILMNILQVVPELNAGGVERTTIEITQALCITGHSAHVASEGGRLEGELKAAGGILHHLPMSSKNPFLVRANTRALIRLIKAHNIDLIHVRSRAPAFAARAAAQKTNIAFVTTYHGIYNARSKLKRAYNAVMTKGQMVIANSGFTKAHIIKEHGTPECKITVIPRGVDMDAFDPANITAKDIQACRQNWGAGGTRPILLLPGRLTRWKGQIVAIKALAHLHKTGTNADLVLLGDAQGRQAYVRELKDLAESLGVAKHIFMAAHSKDMPTAYASADLVISASTDPEAFGRVAVEAQAMGKWMLASQHGGALETVVDGKSGYLTPPADAQALTGAIIRALNLPPKGKKKRAQTSRARIAKQFSATSMQNATLMLYAQAITAHADKKATSQ